MSDEGSAPDPNERIELLLRDLRTSRGGLTEREAERRLLAYGPNELRRRGGPALAARAGAAVHPSAGAAAVGRRGPRRDRRDRSGGDRRRRRDRPQRGFAFAQEQQAERAVEALRRVTCRRRRPCSATASRAGSRPRGWSRATSSLIAEGDRISADARLIEGAVEVDMSTLTGESATAMRSAEAGRHRPAP